MEELKKDPQARLKRRLGGGLLWVTLLVSAALHFAVWGVAAMPGDALGKKGAVKMGDGKLSLKVVRTQYNRLPPPPSIEPATAPETAPRGLATKGDVGEVPLPVPDDRADVTSWRTDAGDRPGVVGDDVKLIVVDPPDKNGPDVPVWLRGVDVTIEYSQPPRLLEQARPRYPEIARESGVEGDVVLFVYIDESGAVRNAVVQSSPGLPALDEEARKAAMKCTFQPAEQQGKPVGVWYNIVMQFRL